MLFGTIKTTLIQRRLQNPKKQVVWLTETQLQTVEQFSACVWQGTHTNTESNMKAVTQTWQKRYWCDITFTDGKGGILALCFEIGWKNVYRLLRVAVLLLKYKWYISNKLLKTRVTGYYVTKYHKLQWNTYTSQH